MNGKMLFILFFVVSHAWGKPSEVKFEVIHEGKDVIWGMDFLPDGRLVYTERSGNMHLLDMKTKKNLLVQGVPKVYNAGQAGLLDVRVHPDFKKNNLIYFSYSEPVGNKSTTALAVGRLDGSELKEVKKLFTGYEPNTNDIHYGSRIEFKDGFLFLTMGDRGQREKAQDLNYHQGKVLRLNLDGTTPKGNPFVSNNKAKPEIFSYGHRNPQGLALHPRTKALWEAEMGPRGGDEINLIEPGKNYGWPVITHGREYHGPKIGEEKKAGMEQPVVYWTPSISPSAIAFHNGDLYLANLSSTHVRRLVLDGEKVVSQEALLKDLGYRWRSLRSGADGFLYLGTDEGKIGRINLK